MSKPGKGLWKGATRKMRVFAANYFKEHPSTRCFDTMGPEGNVRYHRDGTIEKNK